MGIKRAAKAAPKGLVLEKKKKKSPAGRLVLEKRKDQSPAGGRVVKKKKKLEVVGVVKKKKRVEVVGRGTREGNGSKSGSKKKKRATRVTPGAGAGHQDPAADWLGRRDGEEDVLAAASSAEEGEGQVPSAGAGPGGDRSDPGDGASDGASDAAEPKRKRPRGLVKAAEDLPQDLTSVRQRVHDNAAMLSNWREAAKLGQAVSTRKAVLSELVSDCSTYYGYSEELAEYFLRMFSAESAVKFFEANECQRPLTIRTNSLKARRASLMQSLGARSVQCAPVGDWTKVGIKISESSVPIGATPEYLGGLYMIQSASSFIPVMALAPQENETILDMAAAPGGKTTYIGQLMRNTGVLFANDLRKDRCSALAANIFRMGLTNAIVLTSDGRKLGRMLPKLDRCLLDAPCSGSGIIARDPSVKVKRGSADFEQNSSMQKELLLTAVDLVDAGSKTGGFIVYSTCSLAVEENEAVIEHVRKVRNVQVVTFDGAVNFGAEGFTRYRERRFHPSLKNCRRYYPHLHNMDGFFVAKLKKTSNKIPPRIRKDRRKFGSVSAELPASETVEDA